MEEKSTILIPSTYRNTKSFSKASKEEQIADI